jgi:hypothetical protein
MKGGLQTKQIEATVVYFKVASQHLPAATKKNHKNLSQDSQFPSQFQIRGPQIEARFRSIVNYQQVRYNMC